MAKFFFRFIILSTIIGLLIVVFRTYYPLHPNDFNRISKKEEIKFATRLSPSTYYSFKEESNGFEYELMNEFAKFINVKLRVEVREDVYNTINELNGRRVDIISGLGIDNTNEEKVLFSYPYNRIDEYLIFNSNKNSKPKNIFQLNNKSIEFIDSMPVNNIFLRLKKNNPLLSWVIHKDKNTDEMIELLNNGSIDYTVVTSDEFRIYNKFYNNIQVALIINTNEPLAWAVPLDADIKLVEKLTEFFKYLIDSHKLSSIYQKHFKSNQQFSFVGTKIFLNDVTNILPLYENLFKKSAAGYNLDWKLLASVGYQESKWRKNAVSYTGVKGLMMLTNNTAKDLGVKDRTDPAQSIYGGTKYIAQLLKKLPKEINEVDRYWYALTAYNIGYGHLLDAMQLARTQNKDPYIYTEIKPFLLQLSQSKYYKTTKYGYARGWEAIKYIQNIRQYYDILVFLDSHDRIQNPKPNENDKIPNTL